MLEINTVGAIVTINLPFVNKGKLDYVKVIVNQDLKTITCLDVEDLNEYGFKALEQGMQIARIILNRNNSFTLLNQPALRIG